MLFMPIQVGKVPVGSEHPIVKQTMTTTNTRDIDATVAQVGGQHLLVLPLPDNV